MIGSNARPVRWNPPSRPARRSTPVRRRAWRQMFTAPAWPHPVTTTRPLAARRARSAPGRRGSADPAPSRASPWASWNGMPRLEVGGAVDLAGDQHAAVEQQRRLAALDHRRTPRPPASCAAGRAAPTRAARDHDPAAAPHQRVHGDRQPLPPPQAGQAGEPAGVVEVAVAEHDGLDARRRRRPRRSMLSASPFGDTPVSNSSVWVRSPRRMVTRAANPCSATRPGTVSPSSKWGAGTRACAPSAGAGPGPCRPSARRSCCPPAS